MALRSTSLKFSLRLNYQWLLRCNQQRNSKCVHSVCTQPCRILIETLPVTYWSGGEASLRGDTPRGISIFPHVPRLASSIRIGDVR